jgi:hypothetical protein
MGGAWNELQRLVDGFEELSRRHGEVARQGAAIDRYRDIFEAQAARPTVLVGDAGARGLRSTAGAASACAPRSGAIKAVAHGLRLKTKPQQ